MNKKEDKKSVNRKQFYIEKELNDNIKRLIENKTQLNQEMVIPQKEIKSNEIIQKENFANQYIPQYDKENAIKYYDIIISINSLQELIQGWEIKYSEEGYKRYLQVKDKESCVVGIVGNGNKGKSFILHKLAGQPLPSGYSVNTEGLSVKYPIDSSKNIILLDTAGLETPILNAEILNDAPSIDEESQSKIGFIARDKQLTELFLQNFVITQSNILIVVFNILTYSDQKLLNRIKRDC